MTYPHDPGFQKHSETSRMAAETILDVQGQLADVIKAFRDAGPNGLTCDEATKILRTSMRPMIENGTVAARMARLKAEGMILLKNERRKTTRGHPAEVWVYLTHCTQEMKIAHLAANSRRLRQLEAKIDRTTLGVIADFLGECAHKGGIFTMPLLYEQRASELEYKLRKMLSQVGK